MSFWPFNMQPALRHALSEQKQENIRVSQEHQEVTARIVQKAERIAELVRGSRPVLARVKNRP